MNGGANGTCFGSDGLNVYFIGGIGANNKSNMERDNKADIERAVTIEKLDELTREVRRHNGFAERIPILEERTTALTKRVTNLEQKKGA